MIKLAIPPAIPKALQNAGIQLTNTNCASYNANTNSYNQGLTKFDFNAPKNIYGRKSIKKILIKAQNSKCCYCESIFLGTSHGAVEHFRPKGASRQGKNQATIYPGYYWLAYDWSNLLFVCTGCNTAKSSYFPLKNPKQRARNHSQNTLIEKPLFINPAFVEPSNHICFYYEAALGLTSEGKAMVDYIDLNRQSLLEDRLKELRNFIYIISSVIISHDRGDKVDPSVKTIMRRV